MAEDSHLSSIEQQIKRISLEKTQLEKDEIKLRINNAETPGERKLKLVVTALVPTVTACIALVAAYISLVQVQAEKTTLESLRATDFRKARVDKAISLLTLPTTTSSPVVVLSALRDILFSTIPSDKAGAVTGGESMVPVTPGLAKAIVAYVGNSDRMINDTAVTVLNGLNAPEVISPHQPTSCWDN